MKPAHTYHSVPHKLNCDCLGCKMIMRVQQDAYGEGHQDGYIKGKDEVQTKQSWNGYVDAASDAFRLDEIERARGDTW